MTVFLVVVKEVGMKYMNPLIIFLLVFIPSIAVGQCDTDNRPWRNDPMMMAPTIFVTGKITDEDRKLAHRNGSSKGILNAIDGRCSIDAMPKEYIQYMVQTCIDNKQFGKQNFAVVETLQQAYDMDDGCIPFQFYEIKKEGP